MRTQLPPPFQKSGTQQPPPNFWPMYIVAKQLTGWITVPFGTEVGLVHGHIVLDGDSAPHKKWHSPQFSAHVCCGQTAGWINMPLGTEVGLGPGQIVLDGTHLPSKRGTAPGFSAHVYCGRTAGWSPISATADLLSSILTSDRGDLKLSIFWLPYYFGNFRL